MSRSHKTPTENDPSQSISTRDAVVLGGAVLAVLLLVSTMSIDAAALLGGMLLLYAVFKLVVGPKG